MSAVLSLVPFIAQVGEASDSAILIPGGAAGGQDVVLKTGGSPLELQAKRSGVLLDAEDALDGIGSAGSAIVAQSFGINTAIVTTTCKFEATTVPFFVMVNVPAKTTISGVKWWQQVQGAYTATNTNQVGLYSYDPTTGDLTLIASSANNGNLWKAAAQTVGSELFSSPVAVNAGVYWIAVLYNFSGETTAPELGAAANVVSVGLSQLDLPSNGRTYATHNVGDTSLPSSINMSALAASAKRPWLALY